MHRGASVASIDQMIQIHPAFDALYYSPYLSGIRRIYGGRSVSISARGIPNFGHHGMAVIVRRDGEEKRVFISASDGPGLNEQAVEWADVYGKVNLDGTSSAAAKGTDLVPIGPSFPVRVWGPTAAAFAAARALFACKGEVSGIRRHFSAYLAQYRFRLPESFYRPYVPRSDYVFFASRLWRKEGATNHFRANFIRACQSAPGLNFEGGFVPRRARDIEGFGDLTVEGIYPLSQYLEGIRRSVVVFNTPAVRGCHGWKLAEYLALGKAIISTPLLRDLPVALDHGKQIHFVDGSKRSIAAAIKRIRGDHEYRGRLEANARAYYDSYLSPDAVIGRLFAHLRAMGRRG
jgi:glycosyltransferase involved in cell wall biosynthesis